MTVCARVLAREYPYTSATVRAVVDAVDGVEYRARAILDAAAQSGGTIHPLDVVACLRSLKAAE